MAIIGLEVNKIKNSLSLCHVDHLLANSNVGFTTFSVKLPFTRGSSSWSTISNDSIELRKSNCQMSSPRGPPELVLDVDGMMCQKNCATTVRIAIKQCKGVDDAAVTYADREALVWGKNLNVNEIINEIENVGYGAVVKVIGGGAGAEDVDSDPPDMVLSIKGMFDVNTCPDKVNRTLMAVDGVVSVIINFDKKMASIWGFADTESLISALSNAGYVGMDPNAAAPASRTPASSATVDSGTVTFNLDRLRKVAANPSKIESSLTAITGVYAVSVDTEASRVFLSYNQALVSTNGVKQALGELNLLSAVIDSKPALEVVLSSRREINFEVTGMSCANCALKIEKYLSKAPGVVESGVSCMTNKARVVLDERREGAVGPRDLMEKIHSMGYGCELLGEGADSAAKADRNSSASADEMLMWWRLLLISLLFGLPVMCLHLAMTSPAVMMMSMTPVMCRDSVTLGQVTMFCLNLPILLFVGYRYYKAALLGAMHGNYGMDCLVTTGTSITFIYSSFQLGLACQTGEPAHHVFFETTGMLLMFVTVGKYIEAFAKGKSVSAITNLLQLQPREALLVVQQASRPDASVGKSADVLQQYQEMTKTIPVDLVQRGDLLKVLPGQGIPTDSRVESGTSYVDESMITGESIAVMKAVGDLVFGSTVNQNGCLYIRVTSLGSESALAQIVKLVETAQMSKAPVQAYADRVAGMFTPAILLAALLTFAVWYSLSVYGIVPDSWFRQEYNDPLLFSMLFAISVVVISCPCALGLATPTAIMFGTSVGAANGILIKGGSSFEMAHRITTVVFDKTGTLTEGRPSVSDEIVLDDTLKVDASPSSTSSSSSSSSNPLVTADVLQRDYLLKIAATAEQRSEHPLATAVLEAARSRGIPLLPLSENAAVSIVGNGVSCSTEVGRILVGNRGLMEENSITVSSALDSVMWDLEVQGKTAVCVAVDDKVIGVLGIADVPKEEAVSTVKALRGLGVDVWMLTGDSRTTAEALADELEIPKDRVMAGILPKDKVNKVSKLQAAGRFVAMVGDGVNDSPALAQSDLGVAIGTGTQVAIEAADMVLIRNNLHDLVVALDLAKVVFSRIKWNFMWAIVYNAVAIPYAAGVFFPWTKLLLPPQYAGLAMALSSISVVLSSMALRFYKRPNLSSEVAIQKVIAGSIYDKAKRRLTSLKNSIKEKVIQATGKRRGSGPNYQQLPRDEMEADDSLGLELGLGGLGGLRRNSMADDSDGIV